MAKRKKQKVTELTDVDTVSVALVKRGANKKKICFTKSEDEEGQMSDVTAAQLELLGTLMKEKVEGEDLILKEAGAKTPAAQMAMLAATRILSGVKDELPANVFKTFKNVLGTEPEEELNVSEEKKAQEELLANEILEKEAALKEVVKKGKRTKVAANEEVDFEDEVQSEIRKAKSEVLALREALRKEKDESERKSMVAYATVKYSALPIEPAIVGNIMKSIKDLDEDCYEQVQEVLSKTDSFIKKTRHLGELGSAYRGDADSLEAIAEEIVKSKGISKHAAVAEALKTNPHLYGN